MMDDWRHIDIVLSAFKKNPGRDNIYVEPQFGPITTWRWNQALKLRKEMKQRKEIIKGYVEFPAKLMVLYPGEKTYVEKADFSKKACEVEY